MSMTPDPLTDAHPQPSAGEPPAAIVEDNSLDDESDEGDEGFRLFSARTLAIVLMFIIIVVTVTAIFVPAETNPAYTAAITFVEAAGSGNEAAARTVVSPQLIAYAEAECRDGRIVDCIADYTPPEWGDFLSGVFRRAQMNGPDDDRQSAWDIQLIATYEEGQGFSGVCIYNRAERQPDDTWQIVRWSGWVSCDRPDAGLAQLAAADAPNAAPSR